MIINIKNSELLNYCNDANNFLSSELGKKIGKVLRPFFNNNGVRITAIGDKAHAIQKKWLVFENNELKMDGDKPMMQEGLLYEDYLKEFSEYMDATCPFNF